MNEITRLQNHLPLLRTCAGWKANDLAEKLDVSRQTISSWENYDEATGKKGVKLIALHYYAIRKLLDDEIAKDVPDSSNRKKHILGILLEVLVDHPELYSEEDIRAVILEAKLMAPSIVKYPDRRKSISDVWTALFYWRKAMLSNAFITLLGMDKETEDTNMNEGIKKFVELMKTDEGFQAKLKTALESFDGEKTEEAVFEAVLAPLAQEYGISATFAEYKEFVDNRELSEDELAQVAGGADKPWGNSIPCIVNGKDAPCLVNGTNVPEGACPCGAPWPTR